MEKKVIIFGTGKIADVIQFYMREENDVEVVGFTVDKSHLEGSEFNGLPVLPFETIEDHFPPDEYSMFVALGYHDLNKIRATKMQEAESKGYELISYIHPNSGIPKDLKHGKNCFIMNSVCIHPRVTLGDNVFVWSGAMIGHHSKIGDHCWITSCVNISGEVNIGDFGFFAVNCTVGNNVEIGNECFLGANTLVTKNLEDKKVVIEPSSKPIRLDSDKFLKMTMLS